MKPTLSQLERMVGNPDTYAVQQDDEKGTYRPVRKPLDREVLQRHLDEELTVGTYIGHRLDGATVARTLCFDIDNGDGDESLGPAKVVAAALSELFENRVHWGIEFSGRRGYHVWVVLQDYRPNIELQRVGRAVLALSGVQCEVYPKQAEVKDLGNLVKLPGGIHRVTGRQNNFIGSIPRPLPTDRWLSVVNSIPEERARRTQSESRFPCMTAIQEEGATEGSRNIQLFHMATMLRRAGVSDENVEFIVRSTNEKSQPPLDDLELQTLLESSSNAGPICGQLPQDRQCGELCILTRTSGLYTRPGQLRFAGEGEHVVVTLKSRKGNTVEFEHDDVGKMKAVLRGN